MEYYDKSEILTAAGNWTVPDGVTSVRVVLIGGGQGGLTRQKGEDANRVTPALEAQAVEWLAGKGGEETEAMGGEVLPNQYLNVMPDKPFQFHEGQRGQLSTSMPNGTEGGYTTFGLP